VTVSRSSLRARSTIPSEKLARALAEAARSKKAADILIMDMRGLTTVTDFFIVVTVSTDVQSRAVEGAISDRARDDFDTRPWHVEGGEGTRTWVLMDYVDVVVHLCQQEAREFYSLERLCGDALVEKVVDEDPIADGDHTAEDAPTS